MILSRLSLTSVRNYAALEFVPAPGLNVFVGRNAQGKSNLLEAIGMLGTGKSFRTSREAELVMNGFPTCAIAGEARLASGTVRLACSIALAGGAVRKRYTVNGAAVRYAGYLGRLRVVTFVPAHLQLVGGPPALRRSFINAALAQESSQYYAALAAYQKFLMQKNALLRGPDAVDLELLGTYDAHLIEHGTRLMLERRGFIAALAERAGAAYADWAGSADGRLELGYATNVSLETPTWDSVAGAFAERLERERRAELQRKTALVGPHRDDLEFRLGDRALAAFGSQGQQRTAVLALKIAEYETLEARGGEAPVLLLDDVLSELDRERRRAFLRGIASFAQAFVTATAPVDAAAATTYRIDAGRVEALAAAAAQSAE